MNRNDLIPHHGLVTPVGEDAGRVGGEAFEEAFQDGRCSFRCQDRRGLCLGVVFLVGGGEGRGELEISAVRSKLLSYVLG